MVDIVLTADQTLISDYHSNEFVGFGACAPPNIIPEWLYSYLFFPALKTENGNLPFAPYGLRKIEAQLLKEGFKVKTVSPKQLEENLKDAKVLGIQTMDPFGLGPASTTFAYLFKKEPFLAKYFRSLLANPIVIKAKQNGLKVIVGGPGAWQFSYRQGAQETLGIDCIIDGESEKVIGKFVRSAIEGQKLPPHYDVAPSEVPTLDEIPCIEGASINGLIEIGRGCCRGCGFCTVTLRPLRWYSIEKIGREINVNKAAGLTGTCLHAEDVMLYGSSNTHPDAQKLLDIHNYVVKNCSGVGWSHCSLAAVASNPKLFSQVSEIILQKQGWWGAEVGIETGSGRLAEKFMPAKAHPFKPNEWRDVVLEGMGLMHDNHLVPACTLIVGLPDEQESDVIKTMDLVSDLKNMRSLIVPLFFVPLGRLSHEDWFSEVKLSRLHKQLLVQCAEHDFRWVNYLISSDPSLSSKWYNIFIKGLYKGFAAIAKRKMRQAQSHSS